MLERPGDGDKRTATGDEQGARQKIEMQNYSQKDTIFVANGCSCDGESGRMYDKVVEIPEDRDLPCKDGEGYVLQKGISADIGAEKIRDMLYGMHSPGSGGFRKAMKILLGGAS